MSVKPGFEIAGQSWQSLQSPIDWRSTLGPGRFFDQFGFRRGHGIILEADILRQLIAARLDDGSREPATRAIVQGIWLVVVEGRVDSGGPPVTQCGACRVTHRKKEGGRRASADKARDAQ